MVYCNLNSINQSKFNQSILSINVGRRVHALNIDQALSELVLIDGFLDVVGCAVY